MFLPQEFLRKTRRGERLGEDGLRAFFTGFLAGEVADYQVSAWLMAVLLKGMQREDCAALTRLMRDSGEVFRWDFPAQLVVDKHSTGGIGDKTSLVLLPLCILEGLKVPMIAGRGLGHTGGTLDKLEAVGWNVFPEPKAARLQVEKLGGVIMGQTERMVPLDRRLYALRDVTATVESIPLIVASILSKKLAEGLGSLVMDVKLGSGAFMREKEDARALAHELRAVGASCGLSVSCMLTDMDSPLGTYAGNALEVYECVELMHGKGPADTRELCLALAGEMVRLAQPGRKPAEIRASLAQHLDSGAALELFLKVAAAQGGDVSLLEQPQRMLRATHHVEVHAATKGRRVASVDVREVGLAVVALGGGRRLVRDVIDPWVGLTGMKRVGAELAPGEPVCVIHANDAAKAEAAAAMLRRAYVLTDEPVNAPPLVHETLLPEGDHR